MEYVAEVAGASDSDDGDFSGSSDSDDTSRRIFKHQYSASLFMDFCKHIEKTTVELRFTQRGMFIMHIPIPPGSHVTKTLCPRGEV